MTDKKTLAICVRINFISITSVRAAVLINIDGIGVCLEECSLESSISA